jgi:hypothetical protein
MPLRDHFHPPLSKRFSWDGVHGAWPTLITIDLNKRLPPRYVASPNIHLGTAFEIDVSAVEQEEPATLVAVTMSGIGGGGGGGGVATAAWAPPAPTMSAITDLPDVDEYEVRVFDDENRRLVAAIEIIGPANKDREDHRRAFAAKCASLLQQGVSVSMIDLVTTRRTNLYVELLDMLGQADSAIGADPPSQYAVELRYRRQEPSWRLETWVTQLVVGGRLPTLPLWLATDLAIPLDLESTYEETCRSLRIP